MCKNKLGQIADTDASANSHLEKLMGLEPVLKDRAREVWARRAELLSDLVV